MIEEKPEKMLNLILQFIFFRFLEGHMSKPDNVGMFSNMASLNKCALVAFIIAKVSGLCGVALGFLGREYHTLGGALLAVAFISIFSAIIFGLIQTSRDRVRFQREDEEIKLHKNLKMLKLDLESEIRMLEERRTALKNLMIRQG